MRDAELELKVPPPSVIIRKETSVQLPQQLELQEWVVDGERPKDLPRFIAPVGSVKVEHPITGMMMMVPVPDMIVLTGETVEECFVELAAKLPPIHDVVRRKAQAQMRGLRVPGPGKLPDLNNGRFPLRAD